MALNVSLIVDGLIERLPLVQGAIQPTVSRSTVGEIQAIGVLFAVAAVTAAINLALSAVPSKRVEGFWFFRKQASRDGTYIVANSVLVWLPLGIVHCAACSGFCFWLWRVLQHGVVYKNWIVFFVAMHVPLAIAGNVIQINALYAAAGRFRIMPPPWLFHFIQFVVPALFVAADLSTAVMANARWNKAVDLGRAFLGAVDTLKLNPPSTITTELTSAIQDGLQFQAETLQALESFKINLYVCFGWAACIILILLPSVTIVTISLFTALHTPNSASETGLGFVRKSLRHYLLIGFFYLTCSWVITLSAIMMNCALNQDKFVGMSVEKRLRISMIYILWLNAVFVTIINSVLLFRTCMSSRPAQSTSTEMFGPKDSRHHHTYSIPKLTISNATARDDHPFSDYQTHDGTTFQMHKIVPQGAKNPFSDYSN